jgi:hypothetical protein
MKNQSFRDLIDIKGKDNVPLFDVAYKRVRKAIITEQKEVSFFIQLDSSSSIFMATIDKEGFDIFLSEYLKWSEEIEEYERCKDILDLIEIYKKSI